MHDLDTHLPLFDFEDVARRPPAFASPWMVALVALVVGLIIDTLALHQPPGIGLALGLMVGLVVAATASSLLGQRRARGMVTLLTAGLLVAGFVAVRTSPVLLSLNIGAAAAIIAILAQMHGGRGLHDWSMVAYGRHPFSTLGDIASGSSQFAGTDLRAGFGADTRDRMRSVSLGLLIGSPLLIVFGSLFASADVVFSDYVGRVLSGIVFGGIFWRSVVTVVLALAIAGLWRSVRLPRARDGKSAELPNMEVTTGVTVLALLVALFLFFVMTQVVGNQPELVRIGDYSTNARQGFFQLVIVAFLVLNVLLFFDYLIRREDGSRSPAFDRLAVVLIGLTGIVMLSALGRMRLYVAEFGLTELRFYTTVFMFWLAFVLMWFIWTVLRNRHALFAVGLLVSGLVYLVGLNVANPDALIVDANWNRHLDGENFSDRYNSELSVDSILTLIDIRGTDVGTAWCFLDRRLAFERDQLDRYVHQHGPLADSWAAWRARAALRDLDLPQLADFDCVDPRTARSGGD